MTFPRIILLPGLLMVCLAFTGCGPVNEKTAAPLIRQGPTEVQQSDSLKAELANLAPVALDSSDLYATFKRRQISGFIDRKRHPWLFELEDKDSSQFENADELAPVGKLFENAEILSVVFVDYYDYKQALHVFNFKKQHLNPVSSFILYSRGGDAEDFWNISCRKIGTHHYELTESNGYYNDIATMDTTYIHFRQKREIRIDTVSGYITKTVLKTERDLFEIENKTRKQ